MYETFKEWIAPRPKYSSLKTWFRPISYGCAETFPCAAAVYFPRLVSFVFLLFYMYNTFTNGCWSKVFYFLIRLCNYDFDWLVCVNDVITLRSCKHVYRPGPKRRARGIRGTRGIYFLYGKKSKRGTRGTTSEIVLNRVFSYKKIFMNLAEFYEFHEFGRIWTINSLGSHYPECAKIRNKQSWELVEWVSGNTRHWREPMEHAERKWE